MKTIIYVIAFVVTVPLFAQEVDLQLFASGFSNPVGIEHADDDRLFVLEQGGIVKILNSDGSIEVEPFLNLSDSTIADGEQGLLGLAFHPNYSANGYVYVQYSDLEGENKLCRYTRSDADPNTVDPFSEILLKRYYQPFNNHNGGDINFGPDGYLYIALGDGGGYADPLGRAQNPMDYLGKMLRIDVDNGNPYAIPPSNPYVNNNNYLPEIWSVGLRNPWRFSFDSETGDMWIADVGQNDWEEINFQAANQTGGLNYGWKCYEANADFSNCPESDMQFPIFQYSHSEEFGGSSVTGGFVYRGTKFPNLIGKYIFSDFISGNFWMIELTENPASAATHLGDFQDFRYTAFGENIDKDLFVADYTGKIFEIVDTSQILPLQIVEWDLYQQKEEIHLEWESENEHLVDYYIPEKSKDGYEFKALGRVESNGPNNSLRQYYSQIDNDPFSGKSYYRILQANKDGSIDYTNIKSLNMQKEEYLPKLMPNPNFGHANLTSPLLERAKVEISLYDYQGKSIKQLLLNEASSNIALDKILEGINDGIYLLDINIDGQRFKMKLIKQR